MTILRSTFGERLAAFFAGAFLIAYLAFWLLVAAAIVHFVLKLW